MPPVGRPRGPLIIAGISRDLRVLAGREVVNIDVEVRRPRPLPGERNALPVS